MAVQTLSLTRRMLAFSIPLMAIVALSRPAFALTLDEARNQGLVGERPDGYVGVVENASGVRDLVDHVNRERRARYRDTASDTGRPLSEIEAVAGQRLIDRAQSGWYIMDNSGNWVRK